MKIINYLIIFCLSFLVLSCSKVTDPVKKIGLGSRVVDYKSDEKIDSLIIPPDLTEPNVQGIFAENIDISKQEDIVTRIQNVEIKRDQYRRWLLVDMAPNEVWSASKEFFRLYGFKIIKENQKIGLLETDYLEIETKVPDKSLGAIRAGLSKLLRTKYGLPIADKYRIRIESTDDPNKSEVYLTLSSIGEVVSGAMRVWQPREKDVELETEMLLTLMVFLGSDRSEAISKIQSNIKINQQNASVVMSENGFAKLVFSYDKKKSWSYLGWALDELNIDIDDSDPLEGSYFINVTPEKGFFSFLSTKSLTKTYQLIVKEIGESQTQVIFVDLSEQNDSKIIDFSNQLFNEIASKF